MPKRKGAVALSCERRSYCGNDRDVLVEANTNRLVLGGIPLAELVRSGKIATPVYVYDVGGMAAQARETREAFGGERHLIAYAVKANSAGRVVRTFAAEGCGADVVSAAEMEVALGAGIPPELIVYSGVAKRDEEIDRALLAGDDGILSIHVESAEEITRVAARARTVRRKARISLRVNPAVEFETIDTHAHISTGHDDAKFGIHRDDIPAALDVVQKAPDVELVGMTCHAGSQMTAVDGYVQSARTLFGLVRALDDGFKKTLRFVDTGGGFGIDYGKGCNVKPKDFVRAALAERKAAGLDELMLAIEPGRSLVGPFGVLVTRVLQTKVSKATGRRWIMIDAGMTDILRPALYQARHRIVPLETSERDGKSIPWRVVGPVCESTDDFGFFDLPENAPSHVAILDAGAYGFTMASQYNGRALPAEVFVDRGHIVGINPRSSTEDWVAERLRAGT
jgi:diaminopimelate decarboxylase